LGCPAPEAEQFKKLVEDIHNDAFEAYDALLILENSSDSAPPLLLEGGPPAPLATVTEQFVKDDD